MTSSAAMGCIEDLHAMLVEHGDWMALEALGLAELEHAPRKNRIRAAG